MSRLRQVRLTESTETPDRVSLTVVRQAQELGLDVVDHVKDPNAAGSLTRSTTLRQSDCDSLRHFDHFSYTERMDIQNELRTIIAAFNGASIEYALCGGLAVAFHGYARFTKDIDILVSRDSLAKALDIAAHVGFLDSSGKISFPGVELHRVLKTENSEYLILDLMVPSQSDDQARNQKTWFDWEGLPICVVSTDELIAMKRRAGRPQDILDIKMLGFE